MTSTKTILFDLDDTLYDAQAAYSRGLRAAYSVYLSLTEKDTTFDAFSEQYDIAKSKVKSAAPSSPSSHSRLLYFKNLIENEFRSVRSDWIFALNQAYSSGCTSADFEEARGVLNRLHQQYHFGMVTNQTCDTQLSKLHSLDPTGQWFKVMVTSEEAGVEKPDHRVFELALQRLQTNPSQTIMVGDDWRADIQPALQLGMKAFWLSSKKSTDDLPEGVIQIGAISELLNYLSP